MVAWESHDLPRCPKCGWMEKDFEDECPKCSVYVSSTWRPSGSRWAARTTFGLKPSPPADSPDRASPPPMAKGWNTRSIVVWSMVAVVLGLVGWSCWSTVRDVLRAAADGRPSTTNGGEGHRQRPAVGRRNGTHSVYSLGSSTAPRRRSDRGDRPGDAWTTGHWPRRGRLDGFRPGAARRTKVRADATRSPDATRRDELR